MKAGIPKLTPGARRTTFRARLTGATTLLCLSVLVTASSIVYWNARQALRANLDDSLLSIARAEVASALDGPGGSIHVHDEEPTALVLTAGTGYEKYAQIENSADKIIARTDNLRRIAPLPPDPPLEAKARAGQIVWSEMSLRGLPLRAIYYPFPDAHGNHLLAVIAVPEEPMRRALHTLLESVELSLLIGGVISAFGASRLARRLTVPLERISAAAQSVGGTSLEKRIPLFSLDAELQEVTAVLNEMLTRLESAFAAQSRFVADASHELRSPLSNLRGTVEVALRRERTPEEYRQTLQVSLVEIERLSRLASDLLMLSRADTGRLIHEAGCDLRQVAAEAVSAHLLRASEQHIALGLDGQEPLPVWGDADRLRQVLDNLLDNALRHAPTGSRVRVQAQKDAQGYAAVQVSDSGTGLSQEDQDHIFDRFYRADSSRARQPGGTGSGGMGLGLAIARTIAEAHGGQIEVQSRLGAGASFILRIPSAPVPSAPVSEGSLIAETAASKTEARGDFQ